jgi:hypothetical protein
MEDGCLVMAIAHLDFHHFQYYFSFIMAVSFIGLGNQSTWRESQFCWKSNQINRNEAQVVKGKN